MDQRLIKLVAAGDVRALASYPVEDVVGFRFASDSLFEGEVNHWLYIQDSLLHLAAAGHRFALCKALLKLGCAIDHAANRRKATPLHYASDGLIGAAGYSAADQAKTLQVLLTHGAQLEARDANGATPLLRAVRTRCDAAVEALLAAGCDVRAANKSGSTAWDLAQVTSGRGGSGSDEAKRRQQRIIELLAARRGQQRR